ncbi:alpha/beta fold hydrolase [Nocardia asteroides]|uniref:alpha/beta fold hydrolase n=1 Tax=Nocardia asteroides TaxID=1824 RepID=UPI003449EA16
MRSRRLFRPAVVLAAVLFAALPMVTAPAAHAQDGANSAYLSRVESRYADTDLARFHYTRTGSGSPVVLIAGGGLWGYSWRDVVPELATEHTVYAVDLPSQGFTELRRDGFAYDLPAMAEAIAAFLDAVELPRASIVGHSWGGAWSLSFAERYPDRVDKLALLDAPGLDAEKAPVTPLFTTPLLGELTTALTDRAFYADSLRGTFHHRELVTEEVIDEFYGPFARPANRAGFLSLWRNLDYRDTDAGLARITAPTLVLWGAQDTWLPSSQAHELARRIPDATATVLPDCGHALHEDCPAQVDPLLSGFLR